MDELFCRSLSLWQDFASSVTSEFSSTGTQFYARSSSGEVGISEKQSKWNANGAIENSKSARIDSKDKAVRSGNTNRNGDMESRERT